MRRGGEHSYYSMEKKKTVLIVDDSPHIRGLVALILGKKGYAVIQAKDGLDALFLLDAYPVDVIITDMKMPVMDGAEFLRRLQDVNSHRHIPVIGLTAEFPAYSGRVSGVREWIAKPFITRELLEAVEKAAAVKNGTSGEMEVLHGTGQGS